MPRSRAHVVAAVLLLAATGAIAKTPKCTPRRKECRDPLSRCVQNELAVWTGKKKKCRAQATHACRAAVKQCCVANLLDTCCNPTTTPGGDGDPGDGGGGTTTTLPGGPNASLNVTIAGGPPGAGWKIEERFPPAGTPRISCPPTCSYQAPTPTLDVGDLIVVPVNDQRTQNPPWNVISMDQCVGTSSLPSVAPICTPPTSGHVNVTVTLQYRPIVAITFGGTTGDPGLGYAQAYGLAFGSVPVGNSYGLSCYSDSSPVEDCAEHLDAGTGWQIRTVSYQLPGYDVPYELESWTAPCSGGIGPGENLCTFAIPTTDTCVTLDFDNPPAKGLPSHVITGNACPTGSGGG